MGIFHGYVSHNQMVAIEHEGYQLMNGVAMGHFMSFHHVPEMGTSPIAKWPETCYQPWLAGQSTIYFEIVR